MRQLRTQRTTPRVVHLTSAHSAFDSRIFYKECVSLARAGYEVIELTNYAIRTVNQGVRVHGVGRSSGRVRRVLVNTFRMAQAAMQLDADLYHLHDPELLPLGLVLRSVGKTVVYDIHEDLPRTVSYKRYIPKHLRGIAAAMLETAENFSARRMSGLVAATPTIANRFRRIHDNVIVVNNFPILEEIQAVHPMRWEEREMAIAYIGLISEERGIAEIVAALGECSPDVKLHLAGHWADPKLQMKLERCPGWRRVCWHGKLDRAGVRDLLSRVRAGLVVLRPEPNFIASQPIKLFEYMAAGIPVIASDFPAWRPFVTEVGCGVMVNHDQPREIASAIEHLVRNDEDAANMGARGRAAVETRFNWDHESVKLLDFYEALLGAREPLTVGEGSRAEA